MAKKATFNKDLLRLELAAGAPVEISRNAARTIYFADKDHPRVLDSDSDPSACNATAMEHDAQMNVVTRSIHEESTRPAPPSPWKYFDGGFTIPSKATHPGRLDFGDSFEEMPESVEVSFRVSSPKVAPTFSARLFAGEKNAGYLLQMNATGVFIYDMQPRARVGRVPQEQMPFAGKIKDGATDRRVTLYADRPAEN